MAEDSWITQHPYPFISVFWRGKKRLLFVWGEARCSLFYDAGRTVRGKYEVVKFDNQQIDHGGTNRPFSKSFRLKEVR